ncbi:MAG: efflux RND transporter periplasmic adaptor subunit [Chloroflexota bacterium]
MRVFCRPLGLLLVTPALLAACSVAPAGQPPLAPVGVSTAPVATANISGTVVYSGNVESLAKVSILPKVGGQITVLNVDVGSAVKKGDVIAELDHATLDAQVDQAKAAVAVAQARLATIQAGSRLETIVQAKANLTAAQATLSFMENGGRPESVSAAQGNLDSANARLNSLTKGRADSVAQAQANLDAAQARLQQLKDGPTPQQVQAAQLAVEQAKDAAFAADTQKDAACNPVSPGAVCKAAQSAADAAHTGIAQAQAQVTILTSPPTQTQLDQARAAVDAAKAQLQMAQHPGSSSDIAAAEGAVQAAQAQLDLAKAPYTSADLAKAQAAVDDAQQQLKLTQQPYTKEDEAAAQAAVQQANAALDAATVARDDAIVKSPIDGVVAQKLLSVGALAAPSTPIVTLIDPNVDVAVNVDAKNAPNVHLGQVATIVSDDLPGKSISGKVTNIAPAIDPQTRTLLVKITPSVANSGLEDGMLVKVALVTATREGVVAVPSDAIVQRNGQSTVYIVANSTATPQVVQTGLTDGTHTEITSGLKAGQVIVTSGQDRLTTAQPVTVQK